MTTKNKSVNQKKILISALILIAVITLMIGLYFSFKEKSETGTKEVTVTVIDQEASKTLYETSTDAEFLQQLLDELEGEGLTYSGTGADSESGIMIDTVNGLLASYEEDKAYWSIMVNGEYGNYGVSSQPIKNGDAFEIVYVKE